MNKKSAAAIFLAFFIILSLSVAADLMKNSLNLSDRSLRIELEDGCALIARPSDNPAFENSSQILLEKPGGSLHVFYAFESLKIVNLIKADLDGDGFLEIIAVAARRADEDVMPFVFRYKGNLERIFPPGITEDNPIIGSEITTIPTASGVQLCVKVPVKFHEFGPPDLIKTETYRLRGNKLEKTAENLGQADHFNQIMNRGALFMRRGDYSAALRDYETVIKNNGLCDIPCDEAKAEALAAAAECMMYLKNFKGALEFYKRIISDFPKSQMAAKAADCAAFLERYIEAPMALDIYIDIVKAVNEERWNDVLALYENAVASFSKNLDDHFIFKYAQALSRLGRPTEAVIQFKRLLNEYPDSIFNGVVKESLQALEDTTHNFK